MSAIRQAPGGRMARWRALAAVLSLYGLVLQAFLTGLNPVPVAAGAGLLCPSHDTPGGGGPPVHAHACCTLACHAPLAPPGPATAHAWPPRAAVVLSWSLAAAAPARASPARPASARGPPAS
ncbi:hypothetical protein LRS73_10645 [Methylobacterium currus]|uniref:hypothetical protein n=1 Tax=Methylobacterium currus TaxID=2051553 RepID=UPI001E31435A|nr:hypothetical protein [Methylobacterium currus]UHC18257.1 hypothetical protein LRS73_10645 [Methylobacterium currus]